MISIFLHFRPSITLPGPLVIKPAGRRSGCGHSRCLVPCPRRQSAHLRRHFLHSLQVRLTYKQALFMALFICRASETMVPISPSHRLIISSPMAPQSKRILVLGATGVIGEVLLNALVNAKDTFESIGIFTSATTVESKKDLVASFASRGVLVRTGDLYNDNDVLEMYKGASSLFLGFRFPPISILSLTTRQTSTRSSPPSAALPLTNRSTSLRWPSTVPVSFASSPPSTALTLRTTPPLPPRSRTKRSSKCVPISSPTRCAA